MENRKMNVNIRCLYAVLSLFFIIVADASAIESSRVLVLYNANWTLDQDGDGVQDSLQVAEYYSRKRSVPGDNLLGLSCSTNDYYYASYGSFYSDVVQPVKNKLDDLGITGVDVLLVCYGVPYRVPNASGLGICMDNALMGLNSLSASINTIAWKTNPYFETNPGFGTDKGSFNHEDFKFYNSHMYLVTRLDGPLGLKGALELVDHALYGEKYILNQPGYYTGTVYVDSRYGNGSVRYTDTYLASDTAVTSGSYSSYFNADRNIAFSERYASDAGFDVMWENTTGSLVIGSDAAEWSDGTPAATAVKALLYSGWYGMKADPWEWLPGSVGCELHSMSLANLRTADFAGTAVLRRGGSCWSGTIGEPYLSGHQRPNVLLYYILKGYSYAEAAALSTPSIGWMPVNIGDPLYSPFADKTPVMDTDAPILQEGYPFESLITRSDVTVKAMVESSPSVPEAVQGVMEYGITDSYGKSVDSGKGFWRRPEFTVAGLKSGTTYHYRLRLVDPAGNETVTGDYTFTTLNGLPTAGLSVQSSEGTAPMVVTFDGSGSVDTDGTIKTWEWDFGDGETGTGRTVIHTYPDPGVYRAVLTVTDDCGETGSADTELTVNPSTGTMLVLQDGRDGYTGTRDVTLSGYGTEMEWNWGGASYVSTFADGSRRFAVAFDLSMIPEGATVESATLMLHCLAHSYPSDTAYFQAFRMARSWEEGTGIYHQAQDGATWYEYDYVDGNDSDSGDWTASGGDYDPDPIAQVRTATIEEGEWVGLDVTSAVDHWVSGEYLDYGFLIRNNGGPSLKFHSSESSESDLRPRLIIVYSSGGNQSPNASNDTAETSENTSATIDVLANDSDPDGDFLTVTAVTQGSWGSVSLVGDGAVVYTPGAGFTGKDSFTYTISDVQGLTDTATVSMTVIAKNSAPSTVSQTVETDRDIPVAIVLEAEDADGDALAYTIVDPPSSGALSGTAPGVIYTPNPGFTGTDRFSFTANDGTSDSNEAIISITIRDNMPPKAYDQIILADGSLSLDIALSAEDSDGDTLTCTIVTQPSAGTLSGTFPELIYTPDADFNGEDRFAFKVNDGFSDSNTATVSIITNMAPVINSVSPTTEVSMEEGESQVFYVDAADPDGDALAYAWVLDWEDADSGSPFFKWTAPEGSAGSHELVVTVTDSHGSALSIIFTITIAASAGKTVLELQDGQDGYEGTRDATISAYGTEKDWNWGGVAYVSTFSDGSQPSSSRSFAIAFDLASIPSGATIESAMLMLNCSIHSYPSDTAYLQAFRMTRSWEEGTGTYHQPQDGVTWYEYDYVDGESSDSGDWEAQGGDIDPEPVSQVKTSAIEPGEWSGWDITDVVQQWVRGEHDNHGLLFRNTNGPSLRFHSRESLDSGLRPRLVITYSTGSGNPPVAVSDDASTSEDTPVVIDVLANDSDPDGDAIAIISVSQASNGSVELDGDDAVIYTPDQGFIGSDSFTYVIQDTDGMEDKATVVVSVSAAENTLVFQDGEDGYAGTRDVTISGYGTEKDWNWGGVAYVSTFGDGSQDSGVRSFAIAFDLSSIPAGAVIESAILMLNCSVHSYPSDTAYLQAFRMTRSWEEGSGVYHQSPDGATWYEYDYVDGELSDSGDWETQGGDIDPEPVDQVRTNTIVPGEWSSLDVTGAVESWVYGGQENHGFMLRNTGGPSLRFNSREASDPELRPRLVITLSSKG